MAARRSLRSDDDKNAPGEGSEDVQTPESNEETTSIEQKLFLLDQEIRTLHKFCVNQGYTPVQIQQVSGKLISISKILVIQIPLPVPFQEYKNRFPLYQLWGKVSVKEFNMFYHGFTS